MSHSIHSEFWCLLSDILQSVALLQIRMEVHHAKQQENITFADKGKHSVHVNVTEAEFLKENNYLLAHCFVWLHVFHLL